MKINTQKLEEGYKQTIIDFLNEESMRFWEMGIDLNEVTIKDNKMEVFKPGRVAPYGDIYIIKAPDIDSLETDYGYIKVNVIHTVIDKT